MGVGWCSGSGVVGGTVVPLVWEESGGMRKCVDGCGRWKCGAYVTAWWIVRLRGGRVVFGGVGWTGCFVEHGHAESEEFTGGAFVADHGREVPSKCSTAGNIVVRQNSAGVGRRQCEWLGEVVGVVGDGGVGCEL